MKPLSIITLLGVMVAIAIAACSQQDSANSALPLLSGPKTPSCDNPQSHPIVAQFIQDNYLMSDAFRSDPHIDLFFLPVNPLEGLSLNKTDRILVREINEGIGSVSCIASFIFTNPKKEISTNTCKQVSRTEYELQYDTTGQIVVTVTNIGATVCEKYSENEVRSLTSRSQVSTWYQNAAERGNADAQNNLGVMYERGDGVPQNRTAAVKWFRLAADQGHADAQNNLGAMYAYGRGIPRNFAEAAKWFRIAADQGNTYAQYNLAELFYAGEEFGAVADNLTARVYWIKVLESTDKQSQLYKYAQAGISCVDQQLSSIACTPLRCSIEGRSDCPDL